MYGEIEVVSYDWEKQEDQSKEYGQPKPARLVLDKSLKVCITGPALHFLDFPVVQVLQAQPVCQ